jgi:hypothetical protein
VIAERSSSKTRLEVSGETASSAQTTLTWLELERLLIAQSRSVPELDTQDSMRCRCSGRSCRSRRGKRAAYGYGTPMTVALFAGICVCDLTAARAWYGQDDLKVTYRRRD